MKALTSNVQIVGALELDVKATIYGCTIKIINTTQATRYLKKHSRHRLVEMKTVKGTKGSDGEDHKPIINNSAKEKRSTHSLSFALNMVEESKKQSDGIRHARISSLRQATGQWSSSVIK